MKGGEREVEAGREGRGKEGRREGGRERGRESELDYMYLWWTCNTA